MPGLDVITDVMSDPNLVERVTVRRRPDTVNNKGRSVVTPQTFNNVVCVVTAAHGNDLERLPDDQRMGRNLSIVSRFRFQGPAPSAQPDTIEWKGDTFVVKAVDPYPQYGPGFVQAIAGSIDSIDAAPAAEGS